MNQKLPVFSSKSFIQAAKRLGFRIKKGGKGSHTRLIHPKSHIILSVPKAKIVSIGVRHQLFKNLKEISILLKNKLEFDGFNILQNNNECAGQVVPHFHYHIIPRKNGGEKIKIGIILFAKSDTLEYSGLEAYTKRILKDKEMGAQRIFLFSYARRTDKLIYDNEGYVKDFREIKEFKSLEQIERECKEQDFLNLIKKEKYYAKDVKGKQRTAMYYLYEVV